MSHLLILPAGASVCASDIRLVRLLGCSPVALKCRLEVVIWRVPSLIAGSTVAVSIVSVLVHLKPCPRSSLWVTTLIREPQLGPIYPIVMNHVGRILPRLLLIGHSIPLPKSPRDRLFPNRRFSGSTGWITDFGQTDSVAIPFMTGALAASPGIWTLNPL